MTPLWPFGGYDETCRGQLHAKKPHGFSGPSTTQGLNIELRYHDDSIVVLRLRGKRNNS